MGKAFISSKQVFGTATHMINDPFKWDEGRPEPKETISTPWPTARQ